jgi:hypothetical protein
MINIFISDWRSGKDEENIQLDAGILRCAEMRLSSISAINRSNQHREMRAIRPRKEYGKVD